MPPSHLSSIKVMCKSTGVYVLSGAYGILASVPGSLFKRGGESLVTPAGKVFDFWRVIIHGINVGRFHFSNNCREVISCHAISALYVVAAQAIYNFTLCPQGICSSVEFCDALCTCKLGAVKYDE